MPTVKTTHADVTFTISFPIYDARGYPVPGGALPDGYTVTFSSSNINIVSVTQDQNNQLNGTLHFAANGDGHGGTGTATITAIIKDGNNNEIKRGSDQWAVIAGDPATVGDVAFSYTGI